MAKIFGFEIKRSSQKASATVTVIKDLQQTEPSIPLKRSFPRETLGDSGTRALHGIITEDYNGQLQGIQGIKVYDEMRKSDGTVRSVVLVTTLPIRRAKWFVNPATPDTKDEEIANFVEHALFDWIDGMSWDDIIRQALLMVPFGVMVFEKVYGTKDHEGKTYMVLNKLAPRLPRSIQQWELADGTFGIQQNRQDGALAQIPGSKLLIFVNEREGDNWWGTSMLRAAYKHWYYKNNFYKIDAMAFERQGLGVPMIKMPQGYTENDERKAVTAAQNLRANESAYLLLPPGYEAEFMNMGSGTTRDPNMSIAHHNREILKSVLAQFLELGSSSSKGGTGGSKSLSNDHSELFLKGLEALANTLISEFNKNLIPELVDMNFDGVTVYPKLDYAGIDKVDMEKLSKAYSDLVTAGGITPTDGDEQYLRSSLGLPPRTQEDMDADDTDPSAADQIDHADIEDDNDLQDAANKKKDTKNLKKKAKAHEHGGALKRTFDDGSGFMSWRPLTFAEKKVSFDNIEKTMQNMEDSFSQEAKDVLNKSKDAFMAKLHVALNEGDTKAIADLEMKFLEEYKSVLKDAMKKAYEYGKNNVASEMSIPIPPSSAESLANMNMTVDTIANKTLLDLETKAKLSAANSVKNNDTVLQTVGLIDTMLIEQIDKSVDNIAGIIVGQNINTGRNDVFQRNKGMIHALQRSEILDQSTCNFCLSMDGLIVEPTDEWARTDIYHTSCRGIWVEILKDEEDKPDVTGIPENIADFFGGEVNQLIQPPKPITRPGTAVDDFVKQKEAEKQAKKDAKKNE